MFKEIWPVLVPAGVGAVVFLGGLFFALAERRARMIKELNMLKQELMEV